jgi:hypothetical protein
VTHTPAIRRYGGLPELAYSFHDRVIHVTNCGRICLHRKKINLSTVFAGQALGIKEVEEGIWLVSLWSTISATSIWRKKLCSLSTTLLAQGCNLCLRNVL